MTSKLGLLFIFIASGLGSYYVMDLAEVIHHREEQKKDLRRTEMILGNLADRFALFLDLPRNLGIFAQGYYESKSYATDHATFIETKKRLPELLGISYLDEKGLIFKSYPLEENKQAIGRVSQNYPALRAAYDSGKLFWTSPPFSLFQGQRGFTIYTAIRSGGKLQGWIAPVITVDAFERKFGLNDVFRDYGIVITDKESGQHYLATAVPDHDRFPIVEKTIAVEDRQVLIQGWNKNPSSHELIPSVWQIPLALGLGVLVTWAFFLYFQRAEDKSRLRDIRLLLQLTGKDAFKRLIGLSEDIREEDLTYFVNLIEQLDLLLSMVSDEDLLDKEKLGLREVLASQTSDLQDLLDTKFIHIDLKEDLQDVHIVANRWLFENLIVGGLLTHALVLAKKNSTITMSGIPSRNPAGKSFCLRFLSSGQERITKILNRRLSTVLRAIQMEGGDLQIESGPGDEICILLILDKGSLGQYPAANLSCIS